MPQSFYKDIIKKLKSAGCRFERQAKGDHEIWFSPISGVNVTVDRGCKSRMTANAILKQAGIHTKTNRF